VTLLHVAGLRLAWGCRTIFDGLTLTLDEGERAASSGLTECTLPDV